MGVPGGPDGWLLRRVCSRIDRGRLVAVASSRADERRALLHAVSARGVPGEGRAWVQGVPVMPETRAGVAALVGEVDPADTVAGRRSLLWNVLAGARRPARRLGGFLRLPQPAERHAALTALARVGLERLAHTAAATLDAEARTRLLVARALAARAECLVVHELDAALETRDAARVLDRLAAS